MTEAQWLESSDPPQMLAVLRRRATARKIRLFTVACCEALRRGSRYGSRARRAVEILELLADELATPDDLRAAVTGGVTDLARADGDSDLVDFFLTDNFNVAMNGYLFGRATGCDRGEQARLLRDIFGNPFRPVPFSPSWHTDTAVSLTRQMYESRDFSAMPILADALQDAGCDSEDILSHGRGPGPHVRGCWVVDAVLGKE
jgi:hypothetical protein